MTYNWPIGFSYTWLAGMIARGMNVECWLYLNGETDLTNSKITFRILQNNNLVTPRSP